MRKLVSVGVLMSLVAAVGACGSDDAGDSASSATAADSATTAATSDSTAAASDSTSAAPETTVANTGETGTVKIALMDALSGDFATVGVDAMQGAQMALDEINDAGGFEVGGVTYTFDYKLTDLQSDATIAPQAAQEAIQGFGAHYIVGSTLSALNDPIVGVVQRAQDVLHLSAATSMDKVTGQGAPFFRLLPPDTVTAAQYIPVLRAEFPDVTNLSALMINDTVGQSILDIYPPVFEENDFAITSQDSFPREETNYAPLMQRVSDDTDGFFIGYTDAVSTAIAEAAIEAGKPTVFFNRGAACAPGVALGTTIDVYTCIIYTEDALNPSSPEAEEYYAKYADTFDVELSSNSAQSLYYYDYMYMLVEAMKEAGTVDDIEAVADAIRGMSYDGVLNVAFNDEGINETPIKVGIVEAGSVRVVDSQS